MEFIETPMFTKLITDLPPDDDYRLLQDEVMILKALVKKLERHG